MLGAGKRSQRGSTMLRGLKARWRSSSNRDLMIHLDNRYLSLALPENPYF